MVAARGWAGGATELRRQGQCACGAKRNRAAGPQLPLTPARLPSVRCSAAAAPPGSAHRCRRPRWRPAGKAHNRQRSASAKARALKLRQRRRHGDGGGPAQRPSLLPIMLACISSCTIELRPSPSASSFVSSLRSLVRATISLSRSPWCRCSTSCGQAGGQGRGLGGRAAPGSPSRPSGLPGRPAGCQAP